MRQPRRERFSTRIFAHRRTSQPHGTGDPEQGLPAGMPAVHLVVDSLPSHSALYARFQFRRAAGEGTVATGGTNGRAREGWKVPQPGMGTVKPAFDGLPHVGEQVPAIGDLLRLGSAEACTSGILRRAIPGDEFDAGMPFEPAGYRGCRATREEVDDAATIEIDDNRAVAAALPDCPVVDADPDGSRRVGHRDAGDEPQHGRAACRHVEVREETRAACTAAGEADPGLRLAQPPRAPGTRCEEGHGALGEGSASAGWVEAVEPPHLDAEPGLRCRYW